MLGGIYENSDFLRSGGDVGVDFQIPRNFLNRIQCSNPPPGWVNNSVGLFGFCLFVSWADLGGGLQAPSKITSRLL